MNSFSHVPPGFRFHPTDEELVDYYLRKKVISRRFDLDVIKDIDLYKIEPWDLQELCRIGNEEQNEWYFFSHKDKKYPTGTRTNRATAAGFWKATGRDKSIYSKHELIGMRKTLVFYKGRAPNGQKSEWIMHEYRLETDENGTQYRLETDENGTPHQEEGWVVCRVFKKRMATMRKLGENESPMWCDDQVSFMPDMDSPKLQQQSESNNNLTYNYPYNSCKKERADMSYHHFPSENFLQLPLLESPKLISAPAATSMSFSSPTPASFGPFQYPIFTQHGQIRRAAAQEQTFNLHAMICNGNNMDSEVRDWRALDKFVASQLHSHGDVSCKENNYSNAENSSFHDGDDDPKMIVEDLESHEMVAENASTPSSSFQRDMWK